MQTDEARPRPESHAEPARLSGRQFAGCLAVLVTIFLLSGGPIWEHPWRMAEVDAAILWSYSPLPLLVLGCLALSKKLGWASFLFETMKLTMVKYVLTFSIALALWTTTDQPVHAAPVPTRSAPRVAAPLPPSSFAGPTGVVRGRVIGSDGLPAAGALVFLDSDIAPAAPLAEPVRFDNGADGLVPRLAAVQTGQPIEVRSTDGRLHTVVAETDDGAPLFNVPAIRSGAWSRAFVHEPHPRARLRCTVHPGEEVPAELVVVRHGHFATADAEGRFSLAGVPQGPIRIAARTVDGGSGSASLDLGGTAAEIELPTAR